MNLFTLFETAEKKEKTPYAHIDRYVPDITFEGIEEDEKGGEISRDLNTFVLQYINDFEKAVVEENKEVESPIEMDRLATRIGRFYERIRQVVDWKEEHLVRRASIERILKREIKL